MQMVRKESLNVQGGKKRKVASRRELFVLSRKEDSGYASAERNKQKLRKKIDIWVKGIWKEKLTVSTTGLGKITPQHGDVFEKEGSRKNRKGTQPTELAVTQRHRVPRDRKRGKKNDLGIKPCA